MEEARRQAIKLTEQLNFQRKDLDLAADFIKPRSG
jgi:hypothetical protein